MGTVDGMGSVSGVRGWSSLKGQQVAICGAFLSSAANSKLEVNALGGPDSRGTWAEAGSR